MTVTVLVAAAERVAVKLKDWLPVSPSVMEAVADDKVMIGGVVSAGVPNATVWSANLANSTFDKVSLPSVALLITYPPATEVIV